MKNQALFSSKDKSKSLKCRLLQFLIGALRVKSAQCVRLEFRSGSQSTGNGDVQVCNGLCSNAYAETEDQD